MGQFITLSREDIDACHGLRDEIGASADHLLSKDVRACVGTEVSAKWVRLVPSLKGPRA